MPGMRTIQKNRLTGEGFRYLMLLRDFGHLDEQLVSQVVLGFSSQSPFTDEVELDHWAVRRAAAMVLFDDGSQSQDAELLDADWPYIFS
jgi:hypothetical protein